MKNENDRKLTIIPEIDMFLLSLYIHYTIYIYIFIYLFIYYNLIKKHWFKSFNIIVIMPRTDPDIRIRIWIRSFRISGFRISFSIFYYPRISGSAKIIKKIIFLKKTKILKQYIN